MAKRKKKKANKTDLYLSRSSHISQVILVALAIFGYFYTVRPIYQNQLLAEEVSKKETRLNQLQKEIDNFNPQMQALRDKQAGLELEIENLQATKAQAELQIETIQAEKKSLELAINQTEKQLNKAQADVNSAYRKIYIESFSAAVSWQFIINMNNKDNAFDILEKQDAESIKNHLTTPYDAISAVLEDGNPQALEASSIVPERVKSILNESIKTVLEEHKHNLSRPLIDIDSIINGYNTEIAASQADATLKNSFNVEIYEIKTKYFEKLSTANRNEMQRASDFMDQFYDE